MKNQSEHDSGSARLHSITHKPLELIVKDDQSIEIVDSEVSEKYGFYKDGIVTFYNADENDKFLTLFYELSEIEDIREGERGEIVVSHQKLGVRIHHATYDSVPLPPPAEPLDYKRPTISTLDYFVRKNWPDIEHRLAYEEVNDKIYVDLRMLGKKGYDFLQGLQDNNILTEIRMVLENECKEWYSRDGNLKTEHLRVTKSDLLDVLRRIGTSHSKNLFYEVIRRTEWDGVDRIKTFLFESGCRVPNLSPAQQDVYLENVLKSMLLAAIERNVEDSYDSIQFVPVLIGGQGVGKSSLVSKLAVGFYSPTTASVSNTKDFYEAVQGSVIVELQEGVQFATDSPESIKSLIDQTVLSFRKSYAAEASRRKVPYSLVITTNNSLLLSDTTGNRRFFPLYMGVDKILIPAWQREPEYMLQLWAQALELYRDGVRWRDGIYDSAKPNTLKSIYLAVQENATDDVGAPELIKEYLDTYVPKVGSIVNHYELKEFLEGSGYYGADLKRALKVFMKSPASFGFGEAVRTTKYLSSLQQSRVVKEYRRLFPTMDVRLQS